MKDEEPNSGGLRTQQIISSLTKALESYLIRCEILAGPSEPIFTAEKILLLFSGGVDSSVLLHMLKSLFSKRNKHLLKKIHLLHINYHLRGAESDDEAMFIKNFATTEGLTLHQFDEYPTAVSGNIQGIARSLRYEYAIAVAKAEEIFHVFTAHHLDDQLETFLLNLLKGKSPKTLAGNSKIARILDIAMDTGSNPHTHSCHRDILLHRPFIASSTTKSDILHYSELVGLSYSNDSSNAKNEYERNYLRNEIISRIGAEGHFPNWRRNLLRVTDYLQCESNLIRELSEDYLAPLPKWFGVQTLPGFRLTELFFTKLNGHKSQATLLHHSLSTCFPDYRFAHMEIDEILIKLTGKNKMDGSKNKSPKERFSFPLDKKLFRHPYWGEIVFSRGWVAPLIRYEDEEHRANQTALLDRTGTAQENVKIILSVNISEVEHLSTNQTQTKSQNINVWKLVFHNKNQISLVRTSEENGNIPRVDMVIPQSSSLNVTNNDLSLLPLSLFLKQVRERKKKFVQEFRVHGKTIEKRLEEKKYPLPVKSSLITVLSGNTFLGVINPYNSQLFHKQPTTTSSEYWDVW